MSPVITDTGHTSTSMPGMEEFYRAQAQRLRAQIKSPFRGGMVENCARFKFIGGGYKSMPPEQDGHFCIETARQLAGPMAALIDDLVRVVNIIGATQVLKSVCGDAWVVYCMEHILLPMLVLFEDDDKADLYCGMRLMDTVRGHPEIAKLIAESKKESRHNITGTWLKIAGVELLVAGLNEGNVSTLSWPLIWISEAWQHGVDGLLEKAFKRADRFAETCKILNESQAAVAGSDLHSKVAAAHAVPLVWRCPACDGEQTWEWQHWNHRRADDFVARPPRAISTVSIGGQIALINSDVPTPGSYAGMRFGTKAVMDEDTDGATIEQRARGAYWECIWCGHHIQDTKSERMEVCATYQQEYRIYENGFWRTPRQVCFTLPFEAAWDNRFEKTVGNFLAAKAAKAAGNAVKLRDWFLSERAVFYDANRMEVRSTTISAGSYDPAKAKALYGEHFHSVNMAVDCQEDADHKAKTEKSITGWFWYVVRVYDKFGNSKQLARGYCKSWDTWRAVQAFWGVPNDRVIIDIVQWSEQVMNKAVEYRQMVKRDRPHPIFKTMEDVVTWKLLAASPGKQNFKGHKDGIIRPWSPESAVYGNMIDETGRVRRIPLARILFNKTPIQQQVDSLYSGAPGMPKFEFLSRDHLKALDGKVDEVTLGMETKLEKGKVVPSLLSYENQMSAQVYDLAKNKYTELRPDDHYYWCEQALLVRVGMDGLLGQSAVFTAGEAVAA